LGVIRRPALTALAAGVALQPGGDQIKHDDDLVRQQRGFYPPPKDRPGWSAVTAPTPGKCALSVDAIVIMRDF